MIDVIKDINVLAGNLEPKYRSKAQCKEDWEFQLIQVAVVAVIIVEIGMMAVVVSKVVVGIVS